jgi:hypothetical protein
MAQFYLLPPRELVEHFVNEFASKLVPGIPVPSGLWERFISELTASVQASSDCFVLHREEVTTFGTDINDALIEGFGAEPGDLVIETELPRGKISAQTKQWKISPQTAKGL